MNFRFTVIGKYCLTAIILTLILVLGSCIPTAYYYECPGDRIIGDVYLSDIPEEWIPATDSVVYVSDSDTIVFYSTGMQTIDTIMQVSFYCSRTKLFGYDRAWNCINSKAYKKVYSNDEIDFTVNYFYYIYPHIYHSEYDSISMNKSDEDTILFDALQISFKEKVGGLLYREYLAASYRANTKLPYELEYFIPYDSLRVNNHSLNDIYASKWFFEDTLSGQYATLYRKKEGICAMRVSRHWYFLKDQE